MEKKRKILVVDDEPDFLKLASARLKSTNYEVITALSGKEALKKVKREKPDAVLLDILMPQLDGLQTLKRIRRHNRNLPVFMITAFSTEERFKLAKDLNASGFIVKTKDLNKEIENINDLLKIAGRYHR